MKSFFSEATKEEKSFSLKLSLLFMVLFLLLHSLLSENLLEGIAFSFGFFSVSFIAIIYFLQRKKAKRIESVESYLPFVLLPMSAELERGTPFHSALENALRNSKKELKEELGKTIAEINNGTPIQSALFNFSQRNNSLGIKRACSAMNNVYLQGSIQSMPIRQAAKEMLLKQKNMSKEFSSKLVIYSLMFISVSAIVPAFFLAFVTVGSLFLELDFTPIQVIALTGIVFPAIDLGVLFIIKEKTPVFMKR